jgi:DNA repair protein RAD5
MTSRVATATMDVVAGDQPPPALFFAGSDDEDERSSVAMSMDDLPVNHSSPSLPQTPITSSPPPNEKLFLDDSDDENLLLEGPMRSVKRSQSTMQESSHVEVFELEQLTRRDSKSRVNPEDKSPLRPLSLMPEGSSSYVLPQKKRRMLPKLQATQPLTTVHFLGEVLVPNAWSTVSGKGYVKPNENFSVRRDEDEESKPAKSKLANGASVAKKANHKQMTLTSMLKTQSQKLSKKKKKDTIVRLVNEHDVGAYLCIFNSCGF